MVFIKTDEETKLTEAVFAEQRQKLLNEGFTEHVHTKSDYGAGITSLIFGIPFMIIYILVFKNFTEVQTPYPSLFSLIIIFVLIYISTPIHELLHAVGWCGFSRKNFENIYIFIPSGFSDAYCHYTMPLTFGKYVFGTLLPFIVLSLFFFILSLITESKEMMYFSLFTAFSCGSDIASVFTAMKYKNAVFLDYPVKCGFAAYKK